MVGSDSSYLHIYDRPISSCKRLTCVSVTFNSFAISALSLDDKYFLISNCFSSSKICLPVNVVRAFFFFDLSLLAFTSLAPLWSPIVDPLESAEECESSGRPAILPLLWLDSNLLEAFAVDSNFKRMLSFDDSSDDSFFLLIVLFPFEDFFEALILLSLERSLGKESVWMSVDFCREELTDCLNYANQTHVCYYLRPDQ